MSFDDTAREPEQTFSLNRDPTGELEYPTKYDADHGPGGCGGLFLLSAGSTLYPASWHATQV